jgi:hypothetical protein
MMCALMIRYFLFLSSSREESKTHAGQCLSIALQIAAPMTTPFR